MIDSTIVQADASLDSVSSLHYRSGGYFQQLEQTSDQDSSDGKNLGKRRGRKNRNSDNRRSSTDPDATLFRRNGQSTKLAYKAHVAADSHKGVITSVDVSSAAEDDTSPVPQLLSKHKQRLGLPKTVVADRLYGSQDCLEYLQEQGIETVIRQRGGGNSHGGFDKSKFAYDVEGDFYTCPAGQRLRRRRTDKSKQKAYYSCDKKVCRYCALRAKCVGSPSPQAVRQITRFDTLYVGRAEAVCKTHRGRRLLRLRQTCIEGLFGQAKTNHGFSRARWRRLFNMHIQTLLTATVLNLKKLVNFAGLKASARVAVDNSCENIQILLYFWFCGAAKCFRGNRNRAVELNLQ